MVPGSLPSVHHVRLERIDVYIIIGHSKYGTEEIDTADTMRDARYLRAEYALAFGSGWTITIRRAKS
jgi:hypothetical protein